MANNRTRRGKDTRESILDCAQTAVLQKGFGATSIDELITAVGITKSGFFYHFKDKNDLAKALLERYLADEERIFDDIFSRAHELSDDPLHRFLIALKLLAELLDDMPTAHPGCLVSAFCYQERLFNRDVVDLNREGVQRWRRRFLGHLEKIAERYPPQIPVAMDALADMLSAVVEGGITIGKITGERTVLPDQVILYRDFVKAVFLPPAP